MSTYNNNSYQDPRNVNLKGGVKGSGLVRWGQTGAANWGSNPFSATEVGIYVSSAGKLTYSYLGATTDLGNTGALVNPMTAVGDIVVGGTAGAPTKLVKGSALSYLRMNGAGTTPEWATLVSASPVNSLQFNSAGVFGGANCLFVAGAHPTQDTFTFGATGDNAAVVCYAENTASFRLKGLSFTSAVVQTYAGIYGNDQFDSTGLGLLKTRAVYGSNEFVDLELQSSHALLISATDDVFGVGFVKLAANAQIDFHPYTAGDTIGAKSISFSRVSEATYGAANTTEVVIRSRGNGLMLPSGSIHLNTGVTDGGVGIVSMTTTQKDAISVLTEGLIVYDVTLHKLCVYTAQGGGAGTGWETITSVLE